MKRLLQHKVILLIFLIVLLLASLVLSAILTEGFGLWRQTTAAVAPVVSGGESGDSPLDLEAYSHPEKLLGAYLHSGVDFTPQDSDASLRAAAETAVGYGFNTLFLSLSDGSGGVIAQAMRERMLPSARIPLRRRWPPVMTMGCFVILFSLSMRRWARRST